ncbi:MAG: hypothetical protein ACR2HX_23010 [Pyrinomonadaceae bacterium]
MNRQTQRAAGAGEPPKGEPTKRELERQMQRTRESLAETVGEIKETVEQEYQSVRKTVSGVLDYREQFKDEPLVWSLGALSAGFALGYTVGYAHKNTKGGKQSQLAAFAGSMVDELSTMGQGLVIPALSGKIRELFGIDFSGLLTELGEPKKTRGKGRTKKTPRKGRTTKGDRKKSGAKRTSRKS